jgi:phosphoribosylformylglycinamidine cyclo-ligase
MQALTKAGVVAGMAHITGGGITENLPRIFPKAARKPVSAHIQHGSWPVLPIFRHLQELGSVAEDEMFRTFNMGIGLICVVPQKKLRRAETILAKLNEPFYQIGQITASGGSAGEVVYLKAPEAPSPARKAARA